jgi:hypothetical protein
MKGKKKGEGACGDHSHPALKEVNFYILIVY